MVEKKYDKNHWQPAMRLVLPKSLDSRQAQITALLPAAGLARKDS